MLGTASWNTEKSGNTDVDCDLSCFQYNLEINPKANMVQVSPKAFCWIIKIPMVFFLFWMSQRNKLFYHDLKKYD